jgi:CPA1 family monovalent cation:H+ antiporter
VDPNMIFFIFLPPLLFEAAWGISFKEMKKWWWMIGSFAFLVSRKNLNLKLQLC